MNSEDEQYAAFLALMLDAWDVDELAHMHLIVTDDAYAWEADGS